MASPMSAREAADHIIGKSDDLLLSHGREDLDRIAIRILDALVAAHEARCKHVDNDLVPDHPMILGRDAWGKFQKLRALERGEDVR